MRPAATSAAAYWKVERIHSAAPLSSALSLIAEGKVEITGFPSALSQPRNPHTTRVRTPLPPW
jgi:hypothetical protein